MDLPQRKWLNHATPAGVRDAAFFITICCQERGRNQLCQPGISTGLLEAAQHYHEEKQLYVWLWLLMPDHAHALAGCSRYESLAKVVAAWKRHTARHANVKWQKGFFDHRLRHDESFQEKADYIRMNPVRKGLVVKPKDWPYVWGVFPTIE